MVGIWSPYNFGDLMMSGFQQLLVSPLWAWVKFDEALDTLDSTSDLRLQPGSTICSCYTLIEDPLGNCIMFAMRFGRFIVDG